MLDFFWEISTATQAASRSPPSLQSSPVRQKSSKLFFPDKKFAKNSQEFVWYFQCQTKLSHLFVLSLSSCMKSISSSGRAFLLQLQWLIEKTKDTIVKRAQSSFYPLRGKEPSFPFLTGLVHPMPSSCPSRPMSSVCKEKHSPHK